MVDIQQVNIWNHVRTVLIDLDGVLFDSRFDNEFWLDHLPCQVAKLRGISLEQATRTFYHHYSRDKYTLRWYSIPVWSRVLQVDVDRLQRQFVITLRLLDGALVWLNSLKKAGIRRVLTTNAHPQTLVAKFFAIDLRPSLDEIHSSAEIGAPKESQAFWQCVIGRQSAMGEVPFDPNTTLVIDDAERVLTSAKQFGIKHQLFARQPDSTKPPRPGNGFTGFTRLAEIHPQWA